MELSWAMMCLTHLSRGWAELGQLPGEHSPFVCLQRRPFGAELVAVGPGPDQRWPAVFSDDVAQSGQPRSDLAGRQPARAGQLREQQPRGSGLEQHEPQGVRIPLGGLAPTP